MKWIIGVGLCAGPALGVIVIFIVTIRDIASKIANRRRRNRVWCCWGVNVRVGLVPREVFDRESRKHWRLMQRCNIFKCLPPVHIRPPKNEVIVVSADEFRKLMEDGLHFVEWREFFVPEVFTSFSEAYERLNGQPLK